MYAGVHEGLSVWKKYVMLVSRGDERWSWWWWVADTKNDDDDNGVSDKKEEI